MKVEPYGESALAAFNQAKALVREHKYAEARAVNVYRSDRIVIEKMISREEARLRGERSSNAKGNAINE